MEKRSIKHIKKIVVVCTGNSCRSIMAEGYLTAKLKKLNVTDVTVVSFGTGALPGLKPTEEAIKVMLENGIDVSEYVSSGLDSTHIKDADIILVMEPVHKSYISDIVPEAEEKIHLLGEFSKHKKGRIKSIADPLGRSVEGYRTTFSDIKDSIEGFLRIVGFEK